MPSVTQRMPFTLHESLIAASNCNSCCSLPSAQQSLLYPWIFISVPSTATSQMNVHAVMQYNGYMGGRMLLFVNASLTRGMVTNCAVLVRNDVPNCGRGYRRAVLVCIQMGSTRYSCRALRMRRSNGLGNGCHDMGHQGPPFPVVSSRFCDPRAVHGGLCQE